MKLHPAKTALLVIDMQKDFYADGGDAARRGKAVRSMQALPAAITDFANTLRRKGVLVVFTQYVYDPKRTAPTYTEIASNSKGSTMMCLVGSDGAAFAGVQPESQDVVIEKLSYDCFAGTDLLVQLRARNIETVIACGVRTEVCVLYTAGRAFAEGFRSIVASDLVGTYDNKTATANATLDLLRYASFVLPSNTIKNMLLGK